MQSATLDCNARFDLSVGAVGVNDSRMIMRTRKCEFGRCRHNGLRLTVLSVREEACVGEGGLVSQRQICRAADPSATSVQYVRVDHRGPDVLVTQELLDGPDVVA